MPPTSSKKARRSGKIVLYRDQVHTILVNMMGWEPEDAAKFWQLARWETSNPGCIDQMLRREMAKLISEVEAE